MQIIQIGDVEKGRRRLRYQSGQNLELSRAEEGIDVSRVGFRSTGLTGKGGHLQEKYRDCSIITEFFESSLAEFVDESGNRPLTEDIGMPKPGSYVPDVTEGITRVEDLPKAQVIRRSRNYKRRPCPECGRSAYRVRTFTRVLHELGDPVAERPRDLHVTYSQHRCIKCDIYFNADMDDLALPKCHYTHRAVATAVRLVVEDGLPYRAASWHLWRDHRLFVPFGTIQNWVEAAGEKSARARRR